MRNPKITLMYSNHILNSTNLPNYTFFSKLLQKGYERKNHHREVPVDVQTNIKHVQQNNDFFFTMQTAKKKKRNNGKNKEKKIIIKKIKNKQNFEPSTRYLCLGTCTTVKVRSTGRLPCEMTQEMV